MRSGDRAATTSPGRVDSKHLNMYYYTMTAQPSVPPKMFDINAVRVSADEWDKNGQKSADGRCMVCNRPVNDAQAGTWWVWMASDSKLFPMDADDDAAAAYEHDDMGLQPVGATCARKIPKAYRTKADA